MKRSILQTLATSAVLCLTMAATSIAAEQTVVGDGEFPSLAMNRTGQYAITWLDESREVGYVGLAGDAHAPPPKPFAIPDGDAEDASAGVAPDGTRIFNWFGYGLVRNQTFLIPTTAKLTPGNPTPAVTKLPGAKNGFNEQTPRVAVASNGAAVRTWATANGHRANLYASMMPPGGDFQPGQLIFTQLSRSELFAVVSQIDGNGVPIVAWERSGGNCRKAFKGCETVHAGLMVAIGDGAGGFSTPLPITGAKGCEFPLLKTGESGAAILVIDCRSRHGKALYYSMRTPGGQFSPARKLTPDGDLTDSYTTAAVLPDGRVVVAWTHDEHPFRSTDFEQVNASVGVVGQPLSKPRRVTSVLKLDDDLSFYPNLPVLNVGPGGQPYLTAMFGRDRITKIAALHADLSHGPTVNIASWRLQELDVALGDDGAGVALYHGYAKKTYGLVLARFTAPAS